MDKKRRLLIVVDYQNDFVDGSLGFLEAPFLEKPICDKIDLFRSMDADVAFTMDTHLKNYLQTQEGRKLPIPHCLKGSDGWNLYGKVASKRNMNDPVFEKGAFGSIGLIDYLKRNNYDVITLVGLVSHICVFTNAILAKTVLPESEIEVDSSCCGSFDLKLQEKAYDLLEGLQITVLK